MCPPFACMEKIHMPNKDMFDFNRDSISANRKYKHKMRIALSIILFTAISFVLCYFHFGLPFLPSFITIEFSALPEFIASIAYGPIIGAIVCLLKTAIHITVVDSAIISDTASLFVELAFIVIAGAYYHYTVFGKGKNKKTIHRRKTIIKGGFIGMLPALIIQFLAANFFVFPMLDKHYGKVGYSFADVLIGYNDAFHKISPDLPELKAIWQGILAFNIPISFIKLTLVILITALIYPVVSPYLHFKKHRS